MRGVRTGGAARAVRCGRAYALLARRQRAGCAGACALGRARARFLRRRDAEQRGGRIVGCLGPPARQTGQTELRRLRAAFHTAAAAADTHPAAPQEPRQAVSRRSPGKEPRQVERSQNPYSCSSQAPGMGSDTSIWG